MSQSENESLAYKAIAVVLLIVVAIGVAWVRASMEAATFNRVTGGHATAWDALWADLRIVGVSKQEGK